MSRYLLSNFRGELDPIERRMIGKAPVRK